VAGKFPGIGLAPKIRPKEPVHLRAGEFENRISSIEQRIRKMPF
jgi:hypothetical protein